MYIELLNNIDGTFKQYYDKQTNKPLNCFGPISNVNFFVGSNNSGKSRLLRALVKMEKYGINENSQFFNKFIRIFEICENIIEKLSNQNINIHITGPNMISQISNEKQSKVTELANSGITGEININQAFFRTLIKDLLIIQNDILISSIVVTKNDMIQDHQVKILKICKQILDNELNDDSNAYYNFNNIDVLRTINKELLELLKYCKMYLLYIN